MPEAIKADWELIKALYIQGVTANELQRRFGVQVSTLHSRASRHNWKRLAEAVKPQVQGETEAPKEDASAKVRERLSQTIEASVAQLPKIRSWTHAAKVQREMVPLVANAEKLYGWGNQSHTTLVSIGSLRAITVRPADTTDIDPLPLPSTPVLDVIPVTPETPEPEPNGS